MIDHVKYLGIPYQHNSSTFKGCDCLGLLRLIYREEYGITLPEYSNYQERGRLNKPVEAAGLPVAWGFTATEHPKVGDVIMLTNATNHKHIGIISLPGYCLHTTFNGTTLTQYFPTITRTFYHHREVNHDH